MWSQHSGSFTLVVFEEASQSFATPNVACTLWGVADCRKEQHIAFSLMISLAMIIVYVLNWLQVFESIKAACSRHGAG